MSFFTWDEKYSVGIKTFDTHHKKLVELVNELYEAMKTGKSKEVLSPILSSLIDYTRTHFSAEEEMMLKYDYPETYRHKQEHIKLTDQVVKFQDDYSKGNALVTIELGNFLKDWLTNHILTTDKRYAKYFNDKGVK